MPSPVDDIKSRLDLVDIIQEYVPLKVAGANLKGLCPFHHEKTPSFMVHRGRQMWHCFGCFPPGEKVKTSIGLQNIEELHEGGYVYSGRGVLRRILATHARQYAGEVVRVRVRKLGGAVTLTADHHLRVLRPTTRHARRTKQFYRRVRDHIRDSSDPRVLKDAIERYAMVLEIPAAELRKDDFVFYPLPTAVTDIRIVNLRKYLTKTYTFGPHPQEVPYRVKIDESFLKLVGYYIAEGSGHRAYVRFSLGSHEEDFAEEIVRLIKKIFLLNAQIHRRSHGKTGIEISVCHSYLADIFMNLCGKGAANKHIPFIFQELPPSRQMILLEAIWKGDGTSFIANRSTRNHKAIATVSKTLAVQLVDILLRNYFFPSLQVRSERVDEQRVHHRENFSVIWSAEARPQHDFIYPERMGTRLWILPVKSVETRRYSGPVYNLTIERDHSYIATNFAVANCGVGGDMFSFIQKIEHVEFPEALEILAKKANVELKREDPQVRSERQRLKELLSASAQWFAVQLRSARGAEALRYLKETRGLIPDTLEEWLLGFAPEGWEELTRFLRAKGYRDQEMVNAGMALPGRARGVYDRFRGRIMFPLRDHHGAIVGFTGRQLKENKEEGGKYVNTPETLLYHKRAVLFGFDKAKQAIREQGYALVVEGQMDVISLWQAGIRNAIASSGTAFNLEDLQLTLLKRVTDTLVLCFDVDAGGKGAALRGLELAWAAGFTVKLARLPKDKGKDPDEVVRKDKEAFIEAVQKNQPILEYLFTQARIEHPGSALQDKKAVAGALLPYLLRLADPIERDHYLKRMSEELHVSEQALREALAKASPSSQSMRAAAAPAKGTTLPLPAQNLAERMLSLLLNTPPMIPHAAQIIAHEYVPEPHQALYKMLTSWYSESRIHTSEHLIATIEASQPELQKSVQILATRGDLEYQGRSDAELLQEITHLAQSLKRLVLKERVEALSRLIREREQKNLPTAAAKDTAELDALSREFTVLTQALAELEF